MPSAHRRVGLVVDAEVDDALASLRRTRDTTAEAALVRLAVLDGSAFHALIAAATSADADALKALAVVERALANLPDLPRGVRSHALTEIEQARNAGDRATRRERQFAMLAARGRDDGSVALELKERLETYVALRDGD